MGMIIFSFLVMSLGIAMLFFSTKILRIKSVETFNAEHWSFTVLFSIFMMGMFCVFLGLFTLTIELMF